MTKQELIRRVARAPGVGPINKKALGQVIDAVFDEIAAYFVEAPVGRRSARSPRFTYPGFGTFTKKRRPARSGRNPQTGAPILIPASSTVAFQPGTELKAALNRNGAAARSRGRVG